MNLDTERMNSCKPNDQNQMKGISQMECFLDINFWAKEKESRVRSREWLGQERIWLDLWPHLLSL